MTYNPNGGENPRLDASEEFAMDEAWKSLMAAGPYKHPNPDSLPRSTDEDESDTTEDR